MPFYYNFFRSHDNGYLRFVRRIYRPLGFQKGYNFPLWIIFGGAVFGFGCARAMYLDIDGIFRQGKIVPGDWRWFQTGHYRVGIVMHLAAAIPICFLVPWQFLPIVRKAAMWFHRVNGYLLIILLLLVNTGALMVARRSLNGGLDVQVMTGLTAVYTTISLVMAYINIKCLQIDQHRAWMLRAWFVACMIITQRIIQLIAYKILSKIGDYYIPMECQTIDFITSHFGPSQASAYAACREDPVHGVAAVLANFYAGRRVAEIGAMVNITFGPSGIVAFFLHAVGIEMYLHLTPAEHDRLKQVSYEKQVARGWRRPGNTGLTAEVLGDAKPWTPDMDRTHEKYVSDSSPDRGVVNIPSSGV